MAKRKRLTPARLDANTPAAAPEVKSALPSGMRPPIADVAHDAVTTNALLELSDKISTARSEGRWIENIALDSIDDDYLVRDRVDADDVEMETLKQSLIKSGQQTAIEVMQIAGDRYGLISGWRRLMAMRALSDELQTDTIKALVRRPDDASEAYCAMVDENEIRVGLSYYERGRIAARAVDRGVFETEKQALQSLFHAVPRAKRSKIKSFMRIVRLLDDVLSFPTALTERAGLALAAALDKDAALVDRLRVALRDGAPQTAVAEQAIITAALNPKAKADPVAAIALAEGLECVPQANGKLILQGAALRDQAYVARIMQALRDLN